MNGVLSITGADMNFLLRSGEMPSKAPPSRTVSRRNYESAQSPLYSGGRACLFSTTRVTPVWNTRCCFYDAVSYVQDFSADADYVSAQAYQPVSSAPMRTDRVRWTALDSINATSSAIVKYVSQRRYRYQRRSHLCPGQLQLGAVKASHTGCIPFYKHFQTAVKSCSQGGVRGGAATLFYPMWHPKSKACWY